MKIGRNSPADTFFSRNLNSLQDGKIYFYDEKRLSLPAKKHLYYTDVLVTKQENGLLQCQFYRRIFEKNK